MLCGAEDYLLEGHLDSYALTRAIRNLGERETARHEAFTTNERAQVTLNSIGDAVLSTDISGNRPSACRRVPNHRRRHA
jgi:hypothetical protein